MPMIQRDFCRTAVEKVSGKDPRTQIMFDVRACCNKFTLLAFFGFVHHRKTDKNFRHTFLFQAEANVVIFSQTLHVESNTVTVS